MTPARFWLAAIALCIAAWLVPVAVLAQVSGVTAAPVDVTGAIAAALPTCPTPMPDTLTGTTGNAGRCVPQQDATRPTPVQAINTSLASDCSWSVTFGRATLSALPIVHASVVLPANATQPLPCSPMARSANAASGKCFPAQTTTLASVVVAGVSVTAGGQSINPTASSCTAGMPVMVVVREPTQ